MSAAKSAPTVDEVFSFIVELESKHSILDWHIGDVPFYEIIRHHFVQYIFRATGSLENSKNVITKDKISLPSYLADLVLILKNSTAQGWARAFGWNRSAPKPGTGKVAVFPFYRRNTEGVDPHSIEYIRALGKRAIVFGVGEDDANRIDRIHTSELNVIFARLHGRSANRWIAQNLKAEDRQRYQAFIDEIETHFGIELAEGWRKFPVVRLRQYLAQSQGYETVFKLLNLSSVFVVSAIQQGLIGGSRRAGIPIIEIQHGAISKYHPSFNWPSNSNPTNVVDGFLGWGDGWLDGISFAKRTKPLILGALDSYEAIRNLDIDETKGQVVFVSSADITVKLFEVAKACAKANPNLRIIFKAHPREDLSAQVSELEATAGLENLEIMLKGANALEVIKASEYVVGVHSAALFEASGMNKKIAIIKISGWEIGADLVSRKSATLLNPDEAPKKLTTVSKSENPEVFYKRRTELDLSNF